MLFGIPEQGNQGEDVHNVVLPPGLVGQASDQLFSYDRSNAWPETIQNEDLNIQAVVCDNVRRARAFSVTLGGLDRQRATGIESRANDIFPPRARHSSTSGEESVAPDDTSATSYPRPRRVASICVGAFQRSRETGRMFPAANPFDIEPAHPPPYQSPADVTSTATNVQSSNAFLFQSLNDFHFPQSDRSQPGHAPPLFIVNAASSVAEDSDIQDESSLPQKTPLQRMLSNSSLVRVARGAANRTSVVFNDAFTDLTNQMAETVRRTSLSRLYETAKVRRKKLQRSQPVQYGFQYFIYLLIACTIYFVFVGVPLWKGLVWYMYWLISTKFVLPGGFAIFLGLAVFYAFGPLLIFFEPDAPYPPSSTRRVHRLSAIHEAETSCDSFSTEETIKQEPEATNCALIIPCYKSESLIGATLESALKIFPAQNIFVIANGNSLTPLDNTEDVCKRYGVNHTWSPMGSKIIAQYVGCWVTKQFPYVLLIDDDCLLPPNFPITTERLKGRVKCLGYTIKSVGPNKSRGTLCQQAQDIEYKISGLQRAFAGKIGSATFPHGAIVLWDRDFLLKTFNAHPGFSVSEDWFFGHIARKLGSRIIMTTSVFVETETPSAIFRGSGSRGGFGEMTVWKQRFKRWNFFFVNGMWYNMDYILFSWKLGWLEFGTKLFVWQEVYETLLYLLTPFILPISLIVRPSFCAYLFAATFAIYFLNVIIFNEVHLRACKQRVTWLAIFYYMPYKLILTAINVASCYWSIYKYATYFAKRHPKIIEDEKAIEIVLRIEEKGQDATTKATQRVRMSLDTLAEGKRAGSESGEIGLRRQLTVTAVGTRLKSGAQLGEAEKENKAVQKDLEAGNIEMRDFVDV